MTSQTPLAFVLLSKVEHPDPIRIIEAADQMGLALTQDNGDPNTLTFRVEPGGGTAFVALMPAPHPDAGSMPFAPTSPDPETMNSHAAHCIVTALGMPDSVDANDVLMGILTAAVIRSTPAVAAMLGHGAVFHKAGFFADVVEAAGRTIATEITVDITAAQEPDGRMSFLTHGLERYGREEFFVTSAVDGTGAFEYVMSMARWMVADRDKILPTGDTVGRTADEKIIVQRVPSPIEGKSPVIRLDLDLADAAATEAPERKKGFFRRRG